MRFSAGYLRITAASETQVLTWILWCVPDKKGIRIRLHGPVAPGVRVSCSADLEHNTYLCILGGQGLATLAPCSAEAEGAGMSKVQRDTKEQNVVFATDLQCLS